MKNAVLAAMLSILASRSFAQGQLELINSCNTSTNPTATSNGLFWLSTGGTLKLINQDFNAAFYAGTDSSRLSLLATFLLSNGTATHDNSFGPGTFVDPSAGVYTFPSSTTVFVEIRAWTGNFDSYAAAVNAGAPSAQSPIFVNRVDVPPGHPADLTGMPAMVLSGIPEPSTFALVALGGICALLLWRLRKKVVSDV